MAKVNIEGVAAALGLSTASVSYALNGRPGVSEATRKRVVDYAEKLGWQANSSARALAGAKAESIGILLKRDPEMLGTEPYYMSLLAGVEKVLGPANQSLLLRVVDSESADEAAAYRRWSSQRRVDGVILFDLLIDDPRPELLESLGMPFVSQGTEANQIPGRTFIYDTERDVDLIVDHFQSLGHSSILHLTGPLHFVHERNRRDAIASATANRGMSSLSIECDYTMNGSAAETSRILESGGNVTAILTSNDVMAVGALDALRQHRGPSVALVSWDDSILCTMSRPRITALSRFHEEQGSRMTRMILGLIDGKADLDPFARPSELAVRETSTAFEAAFRRVDHFT